MLGQLAAYDAYFNMNPDNTQIPLCHRPTKTS